MSKAIYQQRGSSYFASNEEATVVHNLLPARTFTVEFNPMLGYYLEATENMKLPEIIYGKENKKSEKILNTFFDRPNNTGVILLGEKGSGKTLLTKIVSKGAREKGVPTVLVNSQHSSEDFIKFIQSIKQPCVVVFDEFDKVYPTSNSQNILLTLMDGVFNSQKLFLICMNENNNFNFYFKNRPGRFYYSFNYTTMDADSISEYLEKNVKNKESLKPLNNYLGLFQTVSFDMLKAMVEEVNRYWSEGANISDVLQDLNSSPLEQYCKFKVNKLVIDNVDLSKRIIKYEEEVNEGGRINPFKNNVSVELLLKSESEENVESVSEFEDLTFKEIKAPLKTSHRIKRQEEDAEYEYMYWTPQDIVSVTKEGILFKNKSGELSISKLEEKKEGYLDMIRMAF